MFSGREGQVTLPLQQPGGGGVDRFGRRHSGARRGGALHRHRSGGGESPVSGLGVRPGGRGVDSPPRLGGGGAEAPTGRGGGPLTTGRRAGAVCAPARLLMPSLATPRGSSPRWPACHCRTMGFSADWGCPAAFPPCRHRRPDRPAGRRRGAWGRRGPPAHGVQHAFQLPRADAVLPQVDGLEPDTPFLEPALRLFGVKTLAFSKNLNVHGRSLCSLVTILYHTGAVPAIIRKLCVKGWFPTLKGSFCAGKGRRGSPP